jgi:hypothetical protein
MSCVSYDIYHTYISNIIHNQPTNQPTNQPRLHQPSNQPTTHRGAAANNAALPPSCQAGRGLRAAAATGATILSQQPSCRAARRRHPAPVPLPPCHRRHRAAAAVAMRTLPPPHCHRHRADTTATTAALTPPPLPRFCLRCHRSAAAAAAAFVFIVFVVDDATATELNGEESGRERRGRTTHCRDDAPRRRAVAARQWRCLPRPCPPPSCCRLPTPVIF